MIRVGHAAVAQRTQFALRLRAGTNHCPEIHHRLVEALDALAGVTSSLISHSRFSTSFSPASR
jgi:hypothetical protein